MSSYVPPAHVHFFKTMSSITLGHNHLLRLYTFNVNGTAYDGHVHQYQGITGIRYGHYHNYFGTTGPAIPLQNGMHIHFLEGIVELNAYNTSRGGALVSSAQKTGLIKELHQHSYSGYSTAGFGYEPW
ncbi:YmaF family protein [Paenibacillus chondroitinus]|uniref:YmaF family protein n=1 Tax=Paenibacillus chondroitinus TaxID=59842 RepID=A0ABU6DLU2_9BACL|nr:MULTISPECIES: YmaF family protein [Paenibacillus]MCY9656967.1 YmaF family protein [Paenibacillus anseongense]MEB4798763.1 YmaF family protein [Paenibacillus chondroitinus]